MSFVELISGYVERSGTKKESLAAEWCSAFASEKHYTHETVRTQLSRVLKGKLQGVRFFFGQPKRSQASVRVLSLSEDEACELKAEAEKLIAQDGKRAPRALLEMAAFARVRPETWEGILTLLVRTPEAGPFDVMLTEEQHKALPRAWDGYPDLVRVSRYPDAAAARAALRQLAGDDAVILSPHFHQPYERWAAMELDVGGDIVFEPADALAQIANDGLLDEPPMPKHALPVAEWPAQLAMDASEARRLAFDVTAERARSGASAEERARIAAALGVRAAATLEDRLGTSLKDIDAKELARLLRRASRVAQPPTALLLDGKQLVLLNPDEKLAAAVESGEATIHRVEVKPTAMHHLLDALVGFTDEDAIDDPLLVRLVDDLCQSHGVDYELFHARASLLCTRAITLTAAKPVEEPRSVIEKMLEIPLPAPTVRVLSIDEKMARKHSDKEGATDLTLDKIDAEELNALKKQLELVVYPKVKAKEDWPPEELIAPIDLFATAPPLVAGLLRSLARSLAWQKGRTRSSVSIALPHSAHDATDPGRWAEFLEEKKAPATGGNWKESAPPGPEPGFEIEVAAAWYALRRASAERPPLKLHDGRLFYALSGPFAAIVDVRLCARPAPAAVSIVGRPFYPDEYGAKTPDYSYRTKAHGGYVHGQGELLLRFLNHLRVRFEKHVAHIHFVHSALLGSSGF